MYNPEHIPPPPPTKKSPKRKFTDQIPLQIKMRNTRLRSDLLGKR